MSDDLTPVEKRIAIARTWSKRMKTLVNRKRGGMSEAEFCRKHEFDPGFFNRNKNLRVVPTQKTVDAIQTALQTEGV
jgi:hypothetical protein